MKRLLPTLAALLIASSVGATSLTGTLKYGDGRPITGTLTLTPSERMNVLTTWGCGGPASIVPTNPLTMRIVNGAPPDGAAVVGNDCVSPSSSYYNARLIDTVGTLVLQEAWVISGASVDLGQILPVIAPTSKPVILNGDVTGDANKTVVSRLQGWQLSSAAPTNGQVLVFDGLTWKPGNTAGTGTVTQVGMTAPDIFTLTGGPINSSGTFALGLALQPRNTFLAAPVLGDGTPSFRAIDVLDVPPIPETTVVNLVPDLASKVSQSRVVSTTAPLTGGGPLSSDLTLGINAFTPSSAGVVPPPGPGSDGYVLYGNGSWAPPTSSISSIVLDAPQEFVVTGSPLTTGGTLGLAWTTQGQGKVFAAPSGSSGLPAFRPLDPADIPTLPESRIAGLTNDLAGRVPTSTRVSTTLPLYGGGDLSQSLTLGINTFGPSGVSHGVGAVPDPGPGAGTTRALFEDGTWKNALTSLNVTVPAELTVSGVPITSSGTAALGWASQTQNFVFAGPSSGNGTPAFRLLVPGDIPAIPESGVTGLVADLGNRPTNARTIATTAPLLGGGDLSADRTLSLQLSGIGCLTVTGGGLGIANGCITDAMLTPGTGYLKRDGSSQLTDKWNTGDENVGFNVANPAYRVHILGGGGRIQALADPASPAVVPQGTTGAATYQYFVVAVDRNGFVTLPSSAGVTNSGNANLTVTNYNLVQWAAIPGAACYDVLRNDTAHAVATCVTSTQYADTGGALVAYNTPSCNTTGDWTVDGRLYAGDTTITGGVNISGTVHASTFDSTVPTGTAPITVASTTPVTKLTLAADSQIPTLVTPGKVANSATTATAANTPNAIVARDANGDFHANVITAEDHFIGPLTGDVTGNVSGSAATFRDPLAGDVSGHQTTTQVDLVGGSTAANVHSAELLANAATDANTPSTIVKRDANGDFTAGTITGTLNGNATNVTGVVQIDHGGTGQVTAPAAFAALSPMTTQGDTLYQGGGGTASRLAGNTTTTPKFLTSTGNGSAATAPAWGVLAKTDIPNIDESQVINLVTDLAGKVPVTRQVATGAGLTGGGDLTADRTLSIPASGVSDSMLASAPTDAATPSTLMKRDASGNVSVVGLGASGQITSTLSTGTAPLVVASTTPVSNLTLSADTQIPTIATAGKVSNSATTATSANTPSAIVARDGSGNFAAGTITANLAGNVTGSLTGAATALKSATTDVSVSGATAPSNGQILTATDSTHATWQNPPGTGTVTQVNTGAGLTGGPITTTGTLSIPNGGVTDAMLALPYIKGDGSRPLTAGWTAGNFPIDSQNSWRVFNIIAYGADPTGAADSTTAVTNAAAAANAAGGGMVLFPRGTFKVSTIGNPGNNVFFVGEGEGATVVHTTTLNAAIFTFSGTNQGIVGMTIDTVGTPTTGQVLVSISGSNVYARSLRLLSGFNLIKVTNTSGAVRIESSVFYPSVTNGRSLWVQGNNVYVHDCVIIVSGGGTTTTAAQIDLDGGAGFQATNVYISPSGAGARMVWLHNSPGYAQFVNCYIATATSTDNLVQIDSGQNNGFVNCELLGGLHNLNIAGGDDLAFTNTFFSAASQEGILHNAAAHAHFSGCVIYGSGVAASNTYANISLGSASRYFSWVGGSSRNDTTYEKYGIAVNASAKYFYVSPWTDLRGQTARSSGLVQTLSSASTVTPASDKQFVSGTTTIVNITAPGATQPFDRVTFIPTGVWATNTSGNIALASTAVVSKALTFVWDDGAGKWYPSY